MSDYQPNTPKLGSVTWEFALREFLLHKEAAYAPKTVRYYKSQLSGLVAWAETNDVPFQHFGKRHLDEQVWRLYSTNNKPTRPLCSSTQLKIRVKQAFNNESNKLCDVVSSKALLV